MTDTQMAVLVLCTGNSCRSIMTEALLAHYGKMQFTALSAGSNPTGKIHPLSLTTLEANGISVDGYRSKSWNEFTDNKIDIVITVCDNAAGEVCPLFVGSPIKVHWGVEDPAAFVGSMAQKKAEFARIFSILARRVKAMVALDMNNLSPVELAAQLDAIGQIQ